MKTLAGAPFSICFARVEDEAYDGTILPIPFSANILPMSFNAFVVDAAANTVTEPRSAAGAGKVRLQESSKVIAIIRNAAVGEFFLIISILLFFRDNLLFQSTVSTVLLKHGSTTTRPPRIQIWSVLGGLLLLPHTVKHFGVSRQSRGFSRLITRAYFAIAGGTRTIK